MSEQIKRRADMDARWQWHLTDIFASDAGFEAAFAQAAKQIERVAACEQTLAADPAAVIRLAGETEAALDHLIAYACMKRDEDGANPVYQALADRAQSLAVRFEGASAFLRPGLLALPEERLNALLSDGALADYDAMLRKLLRLKPHTLPAGEERVLAMAGDVLGAPQTIYKTLTDVNLSFAPVTDEQGQSVPMTHARFLRFLRSPDRRVRREAFESVFSGYAALGETLAATYAASVKGDVLKARLRGYPDALTASLDPNEIPVSVYDSLTDAVHGAFPALDQYLSLRKRVLGVDELRPYDLYVPMVRDVSMQMTYPEAFSLVCEGLAPLGADYVDALRGAYDGGWIDVYENKAKRSGAYSWGCYGVHPYVLLNHTDDLNGAMTLAHELGHAMHTFHANAAQPYPKAGYSLFVAEVASTCNEMLLVRHLLKTRADRAAQAYLCNHLLEEFRTTVFRQTLFAEFERTAHAMAERGEALTLQSLNAAYMAVNRDYYGRVCTLDDLLACEWMRIPHFYRAYYVYQYATGFSAAVCLSEKILSGGAQAVADYKRFLSAGSSVPPIEALRLAGVDMASPEPVRAALALFGETADRLSALMN